MRDKVRGITFPMLLSVGLVALVLGLYLIQPDAFSTGNGFTPGP